MFDTKRPAVGELLYQLKYGRTQTAAEKLTIADQLAETAASFLKNTWRIAIDAIVPFPLPTSERIRFGREKAKWLIHGPSGVHSGSMPLRSLAALCSAARQPVFFS